MTPYSLTRQLYENFDVYFSLIAGAVSSGAISTALGIAGSHLTFIPQNIIDFTSRSISYYSVGNALIELQNFIAKSDFTKNMKIYSRQHTNKVTLNPTCGNAMMNESLKCKINKKHKLLLVEPGFDLNFEDVLDIECTCKNETKQSLQRILPIGVNTLPVIIYSNCKRCCAAAFKRQMRLTTPPDPIIVEDFVKFSKEMVDYYVGDLLENFDYSYSAWYNHLTYDKQKRIDNVLIDKNANWNKIEYTLFCKSEKQELGGKNRAIAGIGDTTKYVVGPITWELEGLFAKHFPGYCGGKNWEQLEQEFDTAYENGYRYAVQVDGSAFDLCQTYQLKEIDRYIYNKISHSIFHVEKEMFLHHATSNRRILTAKYYSDKTIKVLASALLDGTVLSGSCDTTLMNTIRQALYMHYTLQKAGLVYGRDYLLYCKGDDACILTKEMYDFKNIFSKYWIEPNNDLTKTSEEPFGLGQIAKYIKVGDFNTIDFCSTSVIQYQEFGKVRHKIIRKIDRLNPFTHYSRAAVRMDNYGLKQYYIDVADSIDAFAKDMPLFRDYAFALRYHSSFIELPKKKQKVFNGYLSRRTIDHDNHNSIKQQEEEHLVTGFKKNDYRFAVYGREYVEGIKLRQSKRKPPDEVVYNYYREKYSLSHLDILDLSYFLLQPVNVYIYDPMQGVLHENENFGS